MKNIGYYVCQNCNSITLSTGGATVSCCGRKLDALLPKKAEEHQKLTAELIENDWYLSSNHPMEKNDYISFVAFSTGDTVQLVKQYPEWDLSLRIPKKGHGKLVWYSKKEGLLFQIL